MINPYPTEAGSVSPANLAYIGDAVYELLARLYGLRLGGNTNDLHRHTVSMVCAQAQRKDAEALMAELSEEEQLWFKRGRNAKITLRAHTDAASYRIATGLETLFGWLYLSGRMDRIVELFTRLHS